MERLSLADFSAASATYDALVATQPDIDRFCSSSAWVLPAHAAFAPQRRSWICQNESGFVALMAATNAPGARLLQPLEAVWGFACPCIGQEPHRLARACAHTLRRHEADWDAVYLSGLRADAPLWRALVAALEPRYRLYRGAVTRREQAWLGDGFEPYWARRSANFRKHLRRARRRAAAAGIEFVAHPARGDAAACERLYARILAVEARSWKGAAGVGITHGGMHDFYRLMLPRLADRGAARVMFASLGEQDVAYILGGVTQQTYRGLQASYDHRLAHLSLGHLMQYHQILALGAEGVTTYDLGQENPYKARWADAPADTFTLIVTR